MKTTDIRVRPVIRHAVTRFTSETHANGCNSGGSENLGEFGNEHYAEEVAEALRKAHRPRQWAAIERNHFGTESHALYFDMEADAVAYAEHARANGREFRVFSMEITDPVKLAHRQMGMVSYGFPGGIAEQALPPELPRPEDSKACN